MSYPLKQKSHRLRLLKRNWSEEQSDAVKTPATTVGQKLEIIWKLVGINNCLAGVAKKKLRLWVEIRISGKFTFTEGGFL